jgi:tRNA threonylcarbamoyladenosine biosynthesis protein TsaB
MAVLALDTSTSVGSVAVERDGHLLAESLLPIQATHSETVLPEIDRLLRSCGLGPADVHALVVGAGPGSFTGVRIAASFAKGICHARGVDLYAYSSLAALAAGTGCRGPVCALFDARRGQVYAAGYRVWDGVEEVFPPDALALDDLLERLVPVGDWSFAGDGVGAGTAMIRAAGGRVLPPHLWTPRASALLWLATVAPEAGRVRDPGRWEPRYVRLPGAQRGLRD